MNRGFDFETLRSRFLSSFNGIDLVYVSGYQRCLIATTSFASGSVIIEETPLATGHYGGPTARQVLLKELADLREEDITRDEDAVHPNSTLCDCICSVLYDERQRLLGEKRNEEKNGEREDGEWRESHGGAKNSLENESRTTGAAAAPMSKTMQKIATLCRDGKLENQHAGTELFQCLRPEFQTVCSPEVLVDVVNAIIINRFSSSSGLDLMFYGSMLEHSCAPNIFCGDYDACQTTRKFRALGRINAGERLKIDYLSLPNTYLPTEQRRFLLQSWGFHCGCSRCEDPEEKVRVFTCPACGADAIFAITWRCYGCGKATDQEFGDLCLKAEEEAEKKEDCWRTRVGPLGKFHYRFFQSAYSQVISAEEEELPVDRDAFDFVFNAILWIYTPIEVYLEAHPQGRPDDFNAVPIDRLVIKPFAVNFAHTLAENEVDLDKQRQFLTVERIGMDQYFPDILRKQDEEMWKLLGFGGAPPPEHMGTRPTVPTPATTATPLATISKTSPVHVPTCASAWTDVGEPSPRRATNTKEFSQWNAPDDDLQLEVTELEDESRAIPMEEQEKGYPSPPTPASVSTLQSDMESMPLNSRCAYDKHTVSREIEIINKPIRLDEID